MQLTRTERWILVNQYLILEKLYPDMAKSYQEARQALEEGFELEYDLLAQNIFDTNDTLTTAECREVLDILSMFDALQHSYNALSDKEGIEEWRVSFEGFDGNNETKYMAYARFFCSSGGGRYKNLKTHDDFNSHAPLLPWYQKMLARWKQAKKPHKMTKEQIIEFTAN